MKIAHYDRTNGKLLGWYDDNIHPSIPTPNIKVSDEDWKQAININANFINENGILSKKDFRTLEQLKVSKLKELEVSYSNSIQQNIDYLDTTFQADYESQDLIAKTLTASGGVLPDGFAWRDATNVDVSITFDDLQGLANALLIRGQGNWVKYQELKAQANASTTAEELDAIAW